MIQIDRRRWLALAREEPVDPQRQIVDAHHHLYAEDSNRYLLGELLADTRGSHNVTHTVFCEARSSYRSRGPAAFRPVGETEFVAAQARLSDTSPTRIAGIVAFADLTAASLDEVLRAHEVAGEGRFRGIRHRLAWDASDEVRGSGTEKPPNFLTNDAFVRGLSQLGHTGYSFDAWLYHPQLPDFLHVARAVEGTSIVVNHLGMPLNIGPYTDRGAVRSDWRNAMRKLAACPNVTVKLGGIGMDRRYFRTGWSALPRPPGSDEVAAYWSDDIRWCIDAFGPTRCMFESNFPVDRDSLAYTVVWNTFQKIAMGYTHEEQTELFSGTAARVYRIDLSG